MRRNLVLIVTVMVVICLSATSVLAGNPSFDGPVVFTYGSLHAGGKLVGLGNQDVDVVLNAQGYPVVTCTNQGGNTAPGQNPVLVGATGTEQLPHSAFTKNGTSPFGVAAEIPLNTLTPVQVGCANNNWTWQLVGTNWVAAEIQVWPAGIRTGTPLLDMLYACTTSSFTPGSVVNCQPVK